jgi:hypothetical protein
MRELSFKEERTCGRLKSCPSISNTNGAAAHKKLFVLIIGYMAHHHADGLERTR